MKIIKGDITTIEEGYIFQQVNCQNVMGSGLAKAIADKWPKVKEEYHAFAKELSPLELLGEYQIVWIDRPKLCVVNLFGQLEYGRDGARYTDYMAIKSALKLWGCFSRGENCFFPKFLGCGLGGGSWEIVEQIIEMYFPQATIVEL